MAHFRSHTCKLGSMIALVFIYFVVELVVGHTLHSITLVADSFHMLSDFIALIIGIVARRISKWPKSSKNTFGWQRAEVVGTLLNTVMLITLTFTILIESIQRFIKPEIIERPQLLFGVGLGGLVINVIGMIILGGDHGHSHGPPPVTMEILIKEEEVGEKNPGDVAIFIDDNDVDYHSKSQDHGKGHGHRHGHSHNGTAHSKKGHSHSAGSMNMRAVFLHVLADFFGSVAVVISALIIWLVPNYTNIEKGDTWKAFIDPSISLLMVVLILISTIPLMKNSVLILLQSVPKEVSVAKLKERMEKIDGIDKVHDLHVWLLQSDVIIGTVHIRCANERYVEVSKKAKKLFHDFNIHCTTIQAEFHEHAEDSNSNSSVEGGLNTSGNNEQCVLFCDDRSLTTGQNECRAKQSCCPVKNVSNTVLTNGSSRMIEASTVRVHPILQHQQSAPCLTSYGPSSTSTTDYDKHNSTSSQHLADISEK